MAGLDFFIVGDTLLVVGLYELWLLPLLLVESFRFLLCDLLEGLTLIKGVKISGAPCFTIRLEFDSAGVQFKGSINIYIQCCRDFWAKESGFGGLPLFSFGVCWGEGRSWNL